MKITPKKKAESDIGLAIYDTRDADIRIVITKYKDTGWESDVFHQEEYIGGGTSPDNSGAYDIASDIIFDYENPRNYE